MQPVKTTSPRKKWSLLTDEERVSQLEPLVKEHRWKLSTMDFGNERNVECIEKTFKFPDFCALWGAATQLAMQSHKLNHHCTMIIVRVREYRYSEFFLTRNAMI